MAAQHVIIGSGITGLSAAEAIRQRDPAARIILVSEESHDFYSRPGLAYFLRKDVPEKQLYLRSAADLKTLRLDRVNAQVDRILLNSHELLLTNGKRLRYDRLLVATGALAVPPTFPGGDLDGVVKLDGLDDTRSVIAHAKRAKDAVVVGGGITALELAEGLHARGVKVHYFLRGERYWSDVLDEFESGIVMKRLIHEGIDLRTKTQVKEAKGRKGKLTTVETQSGESVPAQILAVAIGVRPRIDLAIASGLPVNKGILVNEYLMTSVPDVFAAGDCAEVRDAAGRSSQDVLWPIALAQGRLAGANMAGASMPYRKGVPFNVTMLAGLKVAIIGAVGGGKPNEDLVAITRGESEAWRILSRSWIVSDRDEINHVRMVLGERTILGALVMGEQTWTRPLQKIIVGGIDVSPIRQTLMKGGKEALEKLGEFYQSTLRG